MDILLTTSSYKYIFDDYFSNGTGILRKWRIWKVRLIQSLLPVFLFGKSKYLLDVAWLYEYNGNAI